MGSNLNRGYDGLQQQAQFQVPTDLSTKDLMTLIPYFPKKPTPSSLQEGNNMLTHNPFSEWTPTAVRCQQISSLLGIL